MTTVFANRAQTSLSVELQPDDDSISVVSAEGFKTSGTYTVRIAKELLLIAASSGKTWHIITRGSEGTPIAVHPVNSTVTQVLSAGSLDAMRSEIEAEIAPLVLQLREPSLPSGTVGVAYTSAVTAENGTAPYSYAAIGLPAGLALASTGELTGTPTATGNNTVVVTATDANGAIASRAYRVQVHAYSEKVKSLFGSALIGYWQQAEPSGTTATDSSPVMSNGTYANVTLGATGIGDGQTAATYAQSPTSYVNVYSAKLAAAFNPSEFTIGAWIYVSDDAVWTDGKYEAIIDLGNPGPSAQKVRVQKHSGGASNSGVIALFYYGASGGTTVNVTGVTTNQWHFVAFTFSVASNILYSYLDGFLVNTASPTAVISLPLADGYCTISHATAAQAWQGKLAHVFVLNRVASPFEISQLARLDSGTWTAHGAVIEPVTGDGSFNGEPNVIGDEDPVLLTGYDKVMRMWMTKGDPTGLIRSTGYGESPDGKNWMIASGVLIENSYRPFVGKYNGVYWATGMTQTTGEVSIYRSDDGLNFTLVKASVLVANPDTTAWDHYISGNTFVYVEDGIIYLFYDGLNVLFPIHYRLGCKVSTDGGQTWAAYAGNPIQATYGSPTPALADIPCFSHFYHSPVDGKYYGWLTVPINGVKDTNLWRLESPGIFGPWVQSVEHFTLERYSETTGLPAAPGGSVGQLADLSMCEHKGITYAMLSGLPNQESLHYELFSAPMSIDQLVQTPEGLIFEQNYEAMPNGSFEAIAFEDSTNTAYWTATASDGVAARTTVPAEVHADTSRTVAIKLLAGTSVDSRIAQTVLGLVPGVTYSLSGWSRGDGVYAGRVRVQSTTGDDLITWPTTLSNSTLYKPFEVLFTAPIKGQVVITCYCPATVLGTAYFDDLSLRRV